MDILAVYWLPGRGIVVETNFGLNRGRSDLPFSYVPAKPACFVCALQ